MGGRVGFGGWIDTDNKTISVQLNLTGTATGTELGKKCLIFVKLACIPNFSFLSELEVTFLGWMGGWGGVGGLTLIVRLSQFN